MLASTCSMRRFIEPREKDPAQPDRPAAIALEGNIIQSILHSHLIFSCPHADLCGASGRACAFSPGLAGGRTPCHRTPPARKLDRLLDEDLKVIERDLARSALGDEGVKRLMTIPGVDMVVALAIVAAIGDVGRFEQSQKLVSLPWPQLRVCAKQSGPGPAYHGRDHEAGPWACARHARRGGLAGSARAPGSVAGVLPLRIRARRGQHVSRCRDRP